MSKAEQAEKFGNLSRDLHVASFGAVLYALVNPGLKFGSKQMKLRIYFPDHLLLYLPFNGHPG